MILVDENIPEDQCRLLRSWRIRIHQVGHEIGRQGMLDEEHIRPLLHKLDRPTFTTRDLGFFDVRWLHAEYALVCLAVSQNEVARFVRLYLRHPLFNTKSKRMGTASRISAADIQVLRIGSERAKHVEWI